MLARVAVLILLLAPPLASAFTFHPARALPRAAACQPRSPTNLFSSAAPTGDAPRAAFKSKFVGVSWYRPSKKWTAQIQIWGNNDFLGRWDSEEEAARSLLRRQGPSAGR